MKLVVGLGNPGKKYEKNRHNAGFMVVDSLVENLRARGYALDQEWKGSSKGKLRFLWFATDGEKIELIKPQIFMNDSGFSVSYAYKKHSELKHDDVYVIHDDLDIRLGDYKIQKEKGPKDHKGLNSIYKALGARNFWHVRVGIENRRKTPKVLCGEEYVLTNFTNSEFEILKLTIDKIVEDLIDKLGLLEE